MPALGQQGALQPRAPACRLSPASLCPFSVLAHFLPWSAYEDRDTSLCAHPGVNMLQVVCKCVGGWNRCVCLVGLGFRGQDPYTEPGFCQENSSKVLPPWHVASKTLEEFVYPLVQPPMHGGSPSRPRTYCVPGSDSLEAPEMTIGTPRRCCGEGWQGKVLQAGGAQLSWATLWAGPAPGRQGETCAFVPSSFNFFSFFAFEF